MSEVELQEHQGKAMEQTTVPDEVRLDNKLKELWALEKEIFSGDGIVDGQSSDTAIDESYKEGLQQAKTIQQKIDFIESLVLEFQYERKLQELFQKQEKSSYISQEGSKDLQEGKDKVQELFQKYPHFKESIVKYMAEKFDYADYFVQFYEQTPLSPEVDRKMLVEQVLGNMLNHINIEALWDLEKTIQYIQSHPSIDDKNDFLNGLLMWSPEAIPNLWEKMDAVTQLSFYKKEGGYKYAIRFSNSRDDLGLFHLLQCDTKKLQTLDKFFINGKPKDAITFLEQNFPLNEIDYLMQYSKFKDIYLKIKKEEMSINTDKLPEESIIAISHIKDKQVSEKIQKHIWEVLKIENPEDKIKFILNFIKKDLPAIVNTSQNKLDNCYLFSALREFTYFSLEQQAPNKTEVIALELHTLEQKNTQFLQEYINIKLNEIKQYWDNDTLYKLNKINFSNSTSIDIAEKVILLDNIISESTSQKSEKPPKPTQSPEKAPNKIPEMQNSLSRLWLNVKIWENGSLIWINGETNFTQKIWNRTFEVKENGNIFIQWAFGYEFQYENNIDGIEQYLEIADQIEYVDHMGLWHFGTNLKDMIEILNLYTSYTGLKYINVDDSSLNSTNFINQVELTNISKAFYKIWFLSTENFSYWFKNWEMQKVEFTHIMQTNFEWRNFLKWGSFDREMFKNVITETNWKK